MSWTRSALLLGIGLGAAGLAACTSEIEAGQGGTGSTGYMPGVGGSSATAASGFGGATSAASTTSGLVEPANQDAAPMYLEGSPIYTRALRLTNEQWERSVADILGLPESPSAAGFETAVAGTTDFANNELVLSVSNALWEDYLLAAEAASGQAAQSESTLSRIYSGTDAAGFIAKLGRRAYRRPLTPDEQQKYETLFASASSLLLGTESDYVKGAKLVIRTMLQSPHFLYRTELGPANTPLTPYELATKLSFWLRGTTPSDELLDAAASGQLASAEGAVAIARTMLEEPGAQEMMRSFHSELLHFALYDQISKTGVSDYRESMNAEFRESSEAFFDRIFEEGLGLKDILTSTIGFVGPETAELYGQDRPFSGLEERDLGAERAGYFTQLPFLALYGFNDEPDSIHRGLTISLSVLCADPGVPTDVPSLPPLEAGQTNRDRITAITTPCGGACHGTYINPIGFAFENYDGMGRWRDTDNGQPVDATGSYPFTEQTVAFDNASDLMQAMAQSSQAHACYSKKLAGFALQRDIVVGDVALLEAMAATSLATNSIKETMLELVRNPTFYNRSGGAL